MMIKNDDDYDENNNLDRVDFAAAGAADDDDGDIITINMTMIKVITIILI